MKLTKKCATELGKVIAKGLHGISMEGGYREKTHAARGGVLNVFGDIADNIEDPEARIMYCRSFRQELDVLEPLSSPRG